MPDDPAWYPSDWRPEDAAPGDELPTAGLRTLLSGGPLNGRTAHVLDRDSSLWVGWSRTGEMLVRSHATRPTLPPGAALVGRYVWHPAEEALVWAPGEEG